MSTIAAGGRGVKIEHHKELKGENISWTCVNTLIVYDNFTVCLFTLITFTFIYPYSSKNIRSR